MKYCLPTFTQDSSPVTIVRYEDEEAKSSTTTPSSTKANTLDEANALIQTLQKEVESLQNSLALGLADGYYLNFLQWVVKDILKQMEDGTDSNNITLSVFNSPGATDKKESTMQQEVSCLHVLLPKSISWESQSPINNQLSTYESEKKTVNVCIGIPSAKSVRPQFVSWSSEHNILMDVPTTLEVIIENIRESEYDSVDEMQNEYELELHRFASRLAWRLKKSKLDGVVTVASVSGGDMDVLKTFGVNKK